MCNFVLWVIMFFQCIIYFFLSSEVIKILDSLSFAKKITEHQDTGISIEKKIYLILDVWVCSR
jgi:hypothetical protein